MIDSWAMFPASNGMSHYCMNHAHATCSDKRGFTVPEEMIAPGWSEIDYAITARIIRKLQLLLRCALTDQSFMNWILGNGTVSWGSIATLA